MKREYIINRLGKDFVLYEGLLDQAHQEGLKRVATMLLQVPSGENGNVAIVSAEVETSKGVFAGIGDASPDNVNRTIAPHLIRMAETRAKARALRDAVNVGVTAVEELGGDSDYDRQAEPVPSRPIRALREETASGSAGAQPPQSSKYDGPPASSHKAASPNQIATIAKLARLAGLSESPDGPMSAAEASERITELSRLYNQQKEGGASRRTA